jgi:hypothetical protein
MSDVDLSLEELDKKPNNSLYATNRVVVTHEGILDPSQLVRTEGYLWKKGGTVNARGGFRNWKKRWFVLTPVDFLGTQGYELRYYDGPNGNLKGHVGLNDVEIFCETKEHKNQKKVKFEFQILLQAGGVLELSSDSEQERDEWMETLGAVITFLRKVTTSNVMTLNGYDPLCEDDEESYRIGEEIAQNCQAYGPGLFGAEAGKSTHFVVEIHDLSGQKVNMGGMPVTATIEDESSLYYLIVNDNEDGTYSVFYTLGRAGKFKLNITLNEEHHIFGSPYDIEVLPSKTVPALCFAEGDALTRMPSKAISTFIICAVDNYGNRKLRGGDPFEIGIMGPAQLVSLKDNDDGTYTCAVEVLSPQGPESRAIQFSSIMILITLYGKPIQGSPFKPMLLEQSTASAGRTSRPAPAPVSSPAAPAPPSSSSAKAPEKSQTEPRSAVREKAPQEQGKAQQSRLATPAPVAQKAAQIAITPNSKPLAAANPRASQLAASSGPPGPSTTGDPQEQSSPMSRLERSRQRALMAKSLAESNSQGAAFRSNTSILPPESEVSSTFGVPIQTLKSDKSLVSEAQEEPARRGPDNVKTSKLSQIAQRNASSLQALRGANFAATVSTEPPAVNQAATASKPRNTFLTELANNLKQGLGKMNASLNSSSTPQEIELWDVTNRGVTDDKVLPPPQPIPSLTDCSPNRSSRSC